MSEHESRALIFSIGTPVIAVGYPNTYPRSSMFREPLLAAFVGRLAEPWMMGRSLLMTQAPLAGRIAVKSPPEHLTRLPDHHCCFFRTREPDANGARFWIVAWDAERDAAVAKLADKAAQVHPHEWPTHLRLVDEVDRLIDVRMQAAFHCHDAQHPHTSLYSNQEG